MSRTKLIKAYARLDTPDLPERIAECISRYIDQEGIADLPFVRINGRHTGKLTIDNGGWVGDFDFMEELTVLCRLDRNGVVSPDLAKIRKRVDHWRTDLHTPEDDDEYLGVDDEHFDESAYKDDDVENELRSAFYKAEMDSFFKSEELDWMEHDRNLTEIDNLFSGGGDSMHITKIDDRESLMAMIKAMNQEGEEGGGIVWTNPDFEKEMEEYFEEMEERPSFAEFVEAVKNGEFGDLPEDYDGLALPGEPGYYGDQE